ncbi:MAG: hypothetical protein ABS45_09760 [Comamonas sp. SCN 65-56]|jgi:ribosome-associated protein|uniref:ribosome biogenesis factor YjgA n=1 Tax=Comamonas sp. SCN 65-56 TaxID=1660095 RepID=UPI00086CA737|nr:ribosome biogenesis factor YjgA [Comamonas sp. SCN 65-56]ODS91769.1 MAG: hypothetical protein ABS45_09760 [Comamonas sp. SCN 65-56]
MRARARDPQRTEEPSKSQRKREMLALQALGESLLALEDERLERLPVTPELIDAVRTARAIRAHEGRRRQLQYIGRLMREIDADALRDALSDETREHRVATAVMHAAERWRERILADDQAFDDWLAKYPDTRESLEPLVPRARGELATGGPGRAFREIFRKIRDRLA